jgi:PBP1b-binding outer membrane lipoprotein LpoB
MKKVFAILALTAVFAACNNSAEKKEEVKDTTAAPAPAPADSTATPAPADSTATPAPAAVDSTKK